MKSCTHLTEIREVKPSGDGCADCLRLGLTWTHLRVCLSCGNIGCCDSSDARHATRHFHATGHPVIEIARGGRGLALVLSGRNVRLTVVTWMRRWLDLRR